MAFVCVCVRVWYLSEKVFVLKRRKHQKLNDCDLIRFRLTFWQNMVKRAKQVSTHTHTHVCIVTPYATHAACKSWFLHGNKSDKWYAWIMAIMICNQPIEFQMRYITWNAICKDDFFPSATELETVINEHLSSVSLFIHLRVIFVSILLSFIDIFSPI